MNGWINTLWEIREKMENILEAMVRDQNKVMPGQTKPIQVFFSYSHDSGDHKSAPFEIPFL